MDLFGSLKPAQQDQDRIAWLRLAGTSNIGPITFFRLLDQYGTAQNALEFIQDRAKKQDSRRQVFIPSEKKIANELTSLQKMGGHILCAYDEDYPLPLSAIPDAPPVLRLLGDKKLLAQPSIALVGARNASQNGRRFAQNLAQELGQNGQIITSGLARGIDTAAHEGALETGTIAVVAGGLDHIYPKENTKLFESIQNKGLIIAENPLGATPKARDFPRRNRIVSGLSQAVIVVEATERSGSLITARLAAEQGRDVYAVPGHPYDPRSGGPNKLIKDGAALVRSGEDVMDALQNYAGQPVTLNSFQDNGFAQYDGETENDTERFDKIVQLHDDDPDFDFHTLDTEDRILSCLSHTPVQIDSLAREVGLTPAQLQTVLLDLELLGKIERLSGGRIVMCSE